MGQEGASHGPVASVDVTKSPADKKEYRYIVLDNGLKALLVRDTEIVENEEDMGEESDEDEGEQRGCLTGRGSDDSEEESESGPEDDEPEEDGEGDKAAVKKAAAALRVGVGSFSDPWEFQGLSHYLEHMLFMGCKAFPDENEFDSYLTANGGGSNAVTENECTTYFFDCKPGALKGALDRFSGFLVAPLIKEDALEREVLAVDNEFSGVLQSDACRAQQLRAHTASARHVLSKFGWGNRASLQTAPKAEGRDVRDALMRYYSEQYSAERMTLTVLGGEPLDTLEIWARECFREVPSGRGPCPSHAAEGYPFGGTGPELYVLPAVREGHSLQLTFQFPSLYAEYRKKAEDYLSHFIGHEGAGSLLAALKERGWATELSGGISDESTAYFMFDVNMTLTEAGLEHAMECAELAFGYLALLRKSGPQQWAWNEMAEIAAMKFRFQEEEEISHLVTALTADMARYAPEHVLSGSFVYETFDPELIESLLGMMTPDTVRMDVQTSKFAETVRLFETAGTTLTPGREPWFDFEYRGGPISPALLDRWRAVVPAPDLHLPAKNEFVPTDFSLRCDALGLEPETGPFVRPPSLELDEPGLRLWVKSDASFRLPRATAHARLSSAAVYVSARAAAATHTALKLLEDALCETRYSAELAGLQCSCWFEGKAGLDMRIDGFSHRLPLLLREVVGALASLHPTQSTYDRVMETLRLEYRNFNLKPHKHATFLRLVALKDAVWRPDDVLEELQTLALDEVLEFARRLAGRDEGAPGAAVPGLGISSPGMHLEALLHGNTTAEEALVLARELRETLGPCSLSAEARPLERAVLFPNPTRLLHRAAVKNPEEENSVVELYRQVGPDDTRRRALLDLVEQLIQEPCYATLRSAEQLGYSVHCGLRLTHAVLGFAVVIVSGEHGPAHLETRIDSFLTSQADEIAALDPADFEAHKSALIATKLLKHRMMVDEADALWEPIASRRYEFDTRQREVEALESCSQQAVVDFYRENIMSRDRELSVHVVGRRHAGELAAPAPAGARLVEDLAAVHGMFSLYTPPDSAGLHTSHPVSKKQRVGGRH